MVRVKQRYILWEVIWEDAERARKDRDVSSFGFLNEFKKALRKNFGDVGYSRQMLALQMKYFNPITSTGILRIPREGLVDMWQAMTTLTHFKDYRCLTRVIHVGGTIKSCQRALIEFDQEVLELLKRSRVGMKEVNETEEAIRKMENEIVGLKG